jgi:hypothetical protein
MGRIIRTQYTFININIYIHRHQYITANAATPPAHQATCSPHHHSHHFSVLQKKAPTAKKKTPTANTVVSHHTRRKKDIKKEGTLNP